MALDPKYTNLPWIAHGQPDVYEAGELPEVDQKPQDDFPDMVTAREIEKTKISVIDAHKRFANCKVDSTNVDFSDSIAGRGKVGYNVEVDEINVLPVQARGEETLISRYQRLQTEIEQLSQDVSSVEKQTQEPIKDGISPSEMVQLAECLAERLRQVQLNEVGSYHGPTVQENVEEIICGKILEKINTLNTPATSKNNQLEDSPGLVYEIYDRPSLSIKADVEKMADLDRRLERLEALIGQPDPTKLATLTAETANRSLMDVASRLTARSALLQPNQLDAIEARLGGLHTKLQVITEKREAVIEADTQNKIAELYELVKRWNNVADSLPGIVDRLTELKQLHEEASEFSFVLSSIETGQKSVEEKLKTYETLLDEVKNSLRDNMQVVSANLAHIQRTSGAHK